MNFPAHGVDAAIFSLGASIDILKDGSLVWSLIVSLSLSLVKIMGFQRNAGKGCINHSMKQKYFCQTFAAVR